MSNPVGRSDGGVPSLYDFPEQAELRAKVEKAADRVRALARQRQEGSPQDTFDREYHLGRFVNWKSAFFRESESLESWFSSHRGAIKEAMIQVTENRHGHEVLVVPPEYADGKTSTTYFHYDALCGRTQAYPSKQDKKFRGFWLGARLLPLPRVNTDTNTVEWTPRLDAKKPPTAEARVRASLDEQLMGERALLAEAEAVSDGAFEKFKKKTAFLRETRTNLHEAERRLPELGEDETAQDNPCVSRLRSQKKEAETALERMTKERRVLDTRTSFHEERVAVASHLLQRKDRLRKSTPLLAALPIITNVQAQDRGGVLKELDDAQKLAVLLEIEVERGRRWMNGLPSSEGKKTEYEGKKAELDALPDDADEELVTALTNHVAVLGQRVDLLEKLEGPEGYRRRHAVLDLGLTEVKQIVADLKLGLEIGELTLAAERAKERTLVLPAVSELGSDADEEKGARELEENKFFQRSCRELDGPRTPTLPAAEPLESAPAEVQREQRGSPKAPRRKKRRLR